MQQDSGTALAVHGCPTPSPTTPAASRLSPRTPATPHGRLSQSIASLTPASLRLTPPLSTTPSSVVTPWTPYGWLGPKIDDKWRLGPVALTTYALCIVALLAFTAGLLVFQRKQEPECASGGESSYVSMGLTARFAATIVCVLALLCYLKVSSRTPRPHQLHAQGITLFFCLLEVAGLMLYDVFICKAEYVGSNLAIASSFATWSVRRMIFFWVVMRKMVALGPPATCCRNPYFWGKTVLVLVVISMFGGVVPSWLWKAGMAARGVDFEYQTSMSELNASDGADRTILLLLTGVGYVFGSALMATSLVFMVVVWRVIGNVLRKLAARRVSGELFRQARSTLLQHFAGVGIFVISNILFPALTIGVRSRGLLPSDKLRVAMAVGHVGDTLADIVGVMLLSGIGALIFRDDPDGGDVSGRIKSLLRSAVLTSRAQTVFEGSVAATPSGSCIVSFPGKYFSDWNSLTWMCEQGELSSACVFLPMADPKGRYGKHVENLETPGHCWCTSLYGESTPWGCAWFREWRENVEKAVALGLELVVVAFPGQAGRGHVEWQDLAHVDLWDGEGLGGSQKVEVAFLTKSGYSFREEGLEVTRERCFGQNWGDVDLEPRSPA